MIYQFPNYPERKGLRCKDCKHFGQGRITLEGKTGQICHKKVKREVIRDGFLLARCYYAACRLDKVCDMYEPKETDNETDN